MRKIFSISVLSVMIAMLLGACSMGGFKADHKYKIDDFEFTDQHNNKVSLDDLKGTVWIAQFVFTNCADVCLPMMANMTDLQKKLQDAGVEDYKIVSFSVDPKHDTPEILQAYLEEFAPIDESKWIMLTGYSQKTIEDFAIGSFKTFVNKPQSGDQVTHGTAYSLVNQEGVAVKNYSGTEDVPYDTIVSDMKALIKEGK